MSDRCPGCGGWLDDEGCCPDCDDYVGLGDDEDDDDLIDADDDNLFDDDEDDE